MQKLFFLFREFWDIREKGIIASERSESTFLFSPLHPAKIFKSSVFLTTTIIIIWSIVHSTNVRIYFQVSLISLPILVTLNHLFQYFISIFCSHPEFRTNLKQEKSDFWIYILHLLPYVLIEMQWWFQSKRKFSDSYVTY